MVQQFRSKKKEFTVDVDAAMQKLAALGFGLNKSAIWVKEENIYCGLSPDAFEPPKPVKKGSRKPYKPPIDASKAALVGFDTEYQTAPSPLTRSEVKPGAESLKNRVLSYQSAGKIGDFRWESIWCPHFHDRLSLGEYLVFTLGTALASGLEERIPLDIYVIAHFSRADVPGFSDFGELSWELNSVRSTFIVMGSGLTVKFRFGDDREVELNVVLRDTMTLTPASSKSLKALGELVGMPKVDLAPDKAVAKQMISNMELVRRDHWDLFVEYAVTDARICLAYTERLLEKFTALTGRKTIPVTITSIGVDLLLIHWKTRYGDTHSILGKEEIKDGYYDKRLRRFIQRKRDQYVASVYRQLDFATECYHGGRNEQFWFGPSYRAHWNDFDLSSAYPTAMSLIGRADWENIRSTTNIDEFTPMALAMAEVEFEFPDSVKYPCIPVRTINGLIFPLTGVGSCAAPEIYLARKLGAVIKIRWGVIVPTDGSDRIFGEFIRDCIAERKRAGKKTLEGMFWKELSNSTYGKTAQGLREKRVYDLRDRKIQVLPESRITQPFFAAYITSFVRAVLGEIINATPVHRLVFSCTTDGFLTDATDAEMREVTSKGELCQIYSEAQRYLTGEPGVLEQKHRVRRLLGWRTRGQASLEPGEPSNDPEQKNIHVVLAKGGIYTRPEFEEVTDQNEEIVKYFFERTPHTSVTLKSNLGLRDMVELEADMLPVEFERELSMEFDWKRNPEFVGYSHQDAHVYFTTKPWQSIDKFLDVKNLWAEFTKSEGFCIKTVEDFKHFASLVHSKLGVEREQSRYLHRKDPDIQRLRQQFCAAWRNSKAGLEYDPEWYSASVLASLLTARGLPAKRSDIQNAKKGAFIPHSCPRTDRVVECLEKLKIVFPRLDTELFLPSAGSLIDFGSATTSIFASKF